MTETWNVSVLRIPQKEIQLKNLTYFVFEKIKKRVWIESEMMFEVDYANRDSSPDSCGRNFLPQGF